MQTEMKDSQIKANLDTVMDKCGKTKNSHVIVTKLNLPLYKPCKCKYCYKDASVQSVNSKKDASVGITRDKLIPSVKTRSFIAMTDQQQCQMPKVLKDRGINAHFSPERHRIKRNDSTQTNIVKNKDIDMLMQVFEELGNMKNTMVKHSQQNVETVYENPNPEKGDTLEIKEIRIHKNKTKLKENKYSQPSDDVDARELKKIGDYKDTKKITDDKRRNTKGDKKGTNDICGQVTISISRSKDFPEIRFQILPGHGGVYKMHPKLSNETEKEKIISSFNYVQSKN